MNIAVVVPIYKKQKELSDEDKSFIIQIKKIFYRRTIFLVLPKSIEQEWTDDNNFNVIPFEDKFFKNKLSYSNLLCKELFYNCFIDFDYIQVVQTDCWVFDDKLDYFISENFDYIGAPWMVNGFEGKPIPKLWKVGNGGFSLRKVSTFLYIIDQINNSKTGLLPVFQDTRKGLIGVLKTRGLRNNLRHYIKSPPGEDIFWSIYVPAIFNDNEFKIADLLTAANYSFEVLPEFLFNEITAKRLPMGCHNWMNNNPDFWKNYINY